MSVRATVEATDNSVGNGNERDGLSKTTYL